MTFLVSVVIPTFRRHELLNRCLAALLAQDLDPASYEVIVADDAASEDTRQFVDEIAGSASGGSFASLRMTLPTGANEPILPTIRYVPVTGAHGPAAARNAGWRAAHSEIIAFIDDDCIPTINWLKAGVNAFADGVVGVSGKIVIPPVLHPTDYELNATQLAKVDFVTANCFYRREVLEEVGGFDERFKMAWREDSDLVFTLRERNARLINAPEVVVMHPIRSAPWGISLSQQRKSMFNALLYKKHPTLYRKYIQASPPWDYYCIIGALLVTLAGLLAGLPLVALLAFGTWFFLTGLFSMRRLRHTSHAPAHVAEMIVTSMFIPPLAIFWRLVGAFKFRVFFL